MTRQATPRPKADQQRVLELANIYEQTGRDKEAALYLRAYAASLVPQTPENCPKCQGSRSVLGENEGGLTHVPCDKCNGTGKSAQTPEGLNVGDYVKVLRASRLPIEDVIGVGTINRIDGELYWIDGFATARASRELRRVESGVDERADEDALRWLGEQAGRDAAAISALTDEVLALKFAQTPEEWRELERLCEEATPGPWRVETYLANDDYHGVSLGTKCVRLIGRDGEIDSQWQIPETDAAFIAAARTAVPELLRSLTALTERNARLEEATRCFEQSSALSLADAEKAEAQIAALTDDLELAREGIQHEKRRRQEEAEVNQMNEAALTALTAENQKHQRVSAEQEAEIDRLMKLHIADSAENERLKEENKTMREQLQDIDPPCECAYCPEHAKLLSGRIPGEYPCVVCLGVAAKDQEIERLRRLPASCASCDNDEHYAEMHRANRAEAEARRLNAELATLKDRCKRLQIEAELRNDGSHILIEDVLRAMKRLDEAPK